MASLFWWGKMNTACPYFLVSRWCTDFDFLIFVHCFVCHILLPHQLSSILQVSLHSGKSREFKVILLFLLISNKKSSVSRCQNVTSCVIYPKTSNYHNINRKHKYLIYSKIMCGIVEWILYLLFETCMLKVTLHCCTEDRNCPSGLCLTLPNAASGVVSAFGTCDWKQSMYS